LGSFFQMDLPRDLFFPRRPAIASTGGLFVDNARAIARAIRPDMHSLRHHESDMRAALNISITLSVPRGTIRKYLIFPGPAAYSGEGVRFNGPGPFFRGWPQVLRQTAPAPLSNQARERRAWAYPLTEYRHTHLLIGNSTEYPADFALDKRDYGGQNSTSDG
jgi:hypothetical protein